jgi:hypothetical protein
MPKIVVVILDNCVEENKSQLVMQFLAMLSITFYTKVVLIYLILGHSHNTANWIVTLLQPHFEGSVRSPFTLPKMGVWSPSGFSKTQKTISRVKTPRIEMFFIPLEKALKCRYPKWPHMSHLDICSRSYGQKKGRESNCQFDSRPLKVGNRPTPNVRWGSAIQRWKALDKNYNIGLDLVVIGGRGEKL